MSKAPGNYSDLELAEHGINLMNGAPLSSLPADLRPWFSAIVGKARTRAAAAPPIAPTLALGPHVLELLRFLREAAGVRAGEWGRWLKAAQEADAGGAKPLPPPGPAKPRPALRLVK